MDISPIKSQRDYRKVLKEIEGLMGAKRNTPEGDRLDVLVTLVEAWERKHYPMDLPDPVEAIKYHMDQNGLQPRDLIPFIGSRNRGTGAGSLSAEELAVCAAGSRRRRIHRRERRWSRRAASKARQRKIREMNRVWRTSRACSPNFWRFAAA